MEVNVDIWRYKLFEKILTCMDYLALSVQIVQAVQHNLNEQSEYVKCKDFIHEMALQYPERLF